MFIKSLLQVYVMEYLLIMKDFICNQMSVNLHLFSFSLMNHLFLLMFSVGFHLLKWCQVGEVRWDQYSFSVYDLTFEAKNFIYLHLVT